MPENMFIFFFSPLKGIAISESYITFLKDVSSISITQSGAF